MIITKKRDFQELMENIKNYKSFFLIGCSECASLCGTGNQEAIDALTDTIKIPRYTAYLSSFPCQSI